MELHSGWPVSRLVGGGMRASGAVPSTTLGPLSEELAVSPPLAAGALDPELLVPVSPDCAHAVPWERISIEVRHATASARNACPAEILGIRVMRWPPATFQPTI